MSRRRGSECSVVQTSAGPVRVRGIGEPTPEEIDEIETLAQIVRAKAANRCPLFVDEEMPELVSRLHGGQLYYQCGRVVFHDGECDRHSHDFLKEPTMAKEMIPSMVMGRLSQVYMTLVASRAQLETMQQYAPWIDSDGDQVVGMWEEFADRAEALIKDVHTQRVAYAEKFELPAPKEITPLREQHTGEGKAARIVPKRGGA